MTGRRASLLFLVLATLFAAAPASASLKLCNRTSYILYAAVGWPEKTDMVTTGWTWLAPGACAEAISKPLTSPLYYVYARSSRSHSGPARAWGGTISLCVKHGNFTLTGPARARCADGDAFEEPFSEIATKGKADFTETLTESPSLATPEQARIAGLKRLLRDNGYKVGPIDGNDGKETEAALYQFRRKARLSRKTSEDALFKALEKTAARTATPAGYSVCNVTTAPFWTAIGLQSGNAWMSRGWWKVPASGCATLITKPLAADQIYLLVDRPGKAPLVVGKEKFCVTAIAFEIQGRTNCKARGMVERGFAETVTKGKQGFVARVGAAGLVSTPARRNSSDASASRHR